MYQFNKSINKIINNNSNNTNNNFNKAVLHEINNKDLISKNLINTYFDNSNFVDNNEKNKVKNYILISKPEINHSVESVNVNLFYYLSNKEKANAFIDNNKVVNLSKVLSTIYGKSVNINMTRIHYPYLNSNILSKYLSKNASTNNFQHFVDSIITYPNLSFASNDNIYSATSSENNNTLNSFITNITIQLSGRLVTEKVIPRVTKKISRISTNQVSIGTKLKSYGFNENSERNVFIDKSSFTSKNHLGTFTVKVSITSLICNT